MESSSSLIKVSIIVPVYNVEKYLDRCVQSLVHQTLNDIEIILVDDESPDNCPVMCDEWAKKDLRIKVVHKKNEGLGFARNSGLDVASGEYVTFLDSDDFVELNSYENIYNVVKAKDLDICYFKYRRFTDKGNFIASVTDKKSFFFSGRSQVDEFMLNMVGVNPIKPFQGHFGMSVCMGLFRLETIKRCGVRFVSERQVASEDLIFHLEFLPHVEKIGVLPDVYYNYFVNTSSITTSYNEGKYQRMIKLLSVVKDELLKRFTWDEIKEHYYSQQLRIIKIIMRYESISQEALLEKIHRVKRCCKETVFNELYDDSIINRYTITDRNIVRLMKYKLALPIILIYRMKK